MNWLSTFGVCLRSMNLNAASMHDLMPPEPVARSPAALQTGARHVG